MTMYMISFPSGAMQFPPEDFETVVAESHAVSKELMDAGVWVFGGGVDESVPTVKVAADGTEVEGTYPQTALLNGGFTIINVPTREEAVRWAAKIAASCRCAQELRQFGADEMVEDYFRS